MLFINNRDEHPEAASPSSANHEASKLFDQKNAPHSDKSKSAYDIVNERTHRPDVQPDKRSVETLQQPTTSESGGFFSQTRRIAKSLVVNAKVWPAKFLALWPRFGAWVISIVMKALKAMRPKRIVKEIAEKREKKIRVPVTEVLAEKAAIPKPPLHIRFASFFAHMAASIKQSRSTAVKKEDISTDPSAPAVEEAPVVPVVSEAKKPASATTTKVIAKKKVPEFNEEQKKAYYASILTKGFWVRLKERMTAKKGNKRQKVLYEIMAASGTLPAAGETQDGTSSAKGKVRPRGPVVLMVLDGYGIGPHNEGNAIYKTEPSFVSDLCARFPFTPIEAAGKAVGLPEGQIGNSEVGHMHIGAGRIVFTGLSLINEEVKQGRIATNPALVQAIENVKLYGSKFHIVGLLSPGGVHSHQEHIYALMRAVAKEGVKPIVHVFCDGRDVAQKSVRAYIEELLKVCDHTGGAIGSVAGRYYAMDRDQNFERSMLAYDVLTGAGTRSFSDPLAYIDEAYAKGITDEFIEPAFNAQVKDPFVKSEDSVFFANYRPDRARQLAHLFINSSLYEFQPPARKKNLFFVTMAQYEGISPSAVAYPPVYPEQTLGQIIADHGMSQLRIAETEKYAHVTFFLDGGREVAYPMMDKILVPSPKVATYDLKPEMSAVEVTDRLLAVMDRYDFIVVNYANPDMVGHTGFMDATMRAVRTVDSQVKRVYERISQLQGTLFLMADHGNAEVMIDKDGKPQTAHTTNPVPFLITDNSVKLNGMPGSLASVAPTILKYMGLKAPEEMTAAPLI